MTQEKSPNDWKKTQRFDAHMACYGLNDEQISSYCREQGIYPHHLDEWKKGFLSGNQEADSLSRQEQKN